MTARTDDKVDGDGLTPMRAVCNIHFYFSRNGRRDVGKVQQEPGGDAGN